MDHFQERTVKLPEGLVFRWEKMGTYGIILYDIGMGKEWDEWNMSWKYHGNRMDIYWDVLIEMQFFSEYEWNTSWKSLDSESYSGRSGAMMRNVPLLRSMEPLLPSCLLMEPCLQHTGASWSLAATVCLMSRHQYKHKVYQFTKFTIVFPT